MARSPVGVRDLGPPVMLLHGGPGLSCSYLDELAVELASELRVASFSPARASAIDRSGPFTMAQAIEDALCVLDG
jgi:pimeloyl-ACP methyl ester carboxylesterase